MIIAAVIVTSNRLKLLPRALHSVKIQQRKPDFIFVISNSSDANFKKEKIICEDFGFKLIKNFRTENYAGALNSAIELIVKDVGILDNLYFASLDDDDEWMPNYLKEVETHNTNNFDLVVGSLLRKSATENKLLVLPENLTVKGFLIGNPGISGSNTFIRLVTLLKAGSFDEGLSATIDRDLMVRVFLLNSNFKIVHKHLVTQYTDNDRERLTTNYLKKKESLLVFFYKYQYLMEEKDKELFFHRAEKLFSINKNVFEINKKQKFEFSKGDLIFKHKGDYQFIIGFISSDEKFVERILNQIIQQKIPADLVVIVNNTNNSLLEKDEYILKNNIPLRIINPIEWKVNLKKKQYGSAFFNFTEINSIPLGRTILHFHLHNETLNFAKPVYWIIDDDITFNFISTKKNRVKKINVFEIINENIEKVDAIIGSVSNDPPLPFLSTIRCQLVDLLHSHWAKNKENSDFLNLRNKTDYYYDLSDLLNNHLEIPIYYSETSEKAILEIFSGKSVSRKVLQNPENKSITQTVTQRGPNTLVFNRELLHYYPVVNLSINHKFARRGDLLWAFFNQLVSEKKIIENTFSIQQDRSITTFNLEKELEKSAYDIIGYAFNKSFLATIKKIRVETNPNRPKDIFEKLETKFYFDFLSITYKRFLERRKTKFLMNYYRIIGLLQVLSSDFDTAKYIHSEISEINRLNLFSSILDQANQKSALESFIKDLKTTIWSYSNAITTISESEEKHRLFLQHFFNLKIELKYLGIGSEGIVFTDHIWVYKSYFSMNNQSWNFLKEKAVSFKNCGTLENIDFYEIENTKIIRYPYQPFQDLQTFQEQEIIDFLSFCKINQFVFTNIAPKNFIQTVSGQIKLIDYGKSVEPFTKEKFINSIKRGFLLHKFPSMIDENFRELTSKINRGEIPKEIQNWQTFYNQIYTDDH